jgi:hypothetical protein
LIALGIGFIQKIDKQALHRHADFHPLSKNAGSPKKLDGAKPTVIGFAVKPK